MPSTGSTERPARTFARPPVTTASTPSTAAGIAAHVDSRYDQRPVSYAIRIATGSANRPSSPSRSAVRALPRTDGRGALLLDVRTAIRGGRRRPADDPGDCDQGEHVGKDVEEERHLAARGKVVGQAVGQRTREAEQQRRRERSE